jgi:hypothetical protein
MKNLIKETVQSKSNLFFANPFFSLLLIILFTACSIKPEPYSIIEFKRGEQVSNYSKSLLLTANTSDSVNPVVVLGSKGDLFMFGDYMFLLNDTATQTRFVCQYNDSVLYINGKIYSINIPGNDHMIAWMKNLKEMDLSALQIINFESKIEKSYIPYLTELAGLRPDAGLFYNGELGDMAEMLKIFHPQLVAGSTIHRSDYDLFSEQTQLRILMVEPGDSLITDPLPPMPFLEQLFLTGINKNAVISNDLLKNNPQIKRFIMEKSGSLDFSILQPLDNLKELVIRGADSILNFNLINNHKKLELLSIAGDDLVYDPLLIKLPSLRWMTISSNVTQKEFDSFINTHPGLEIFEISDNDSIRSLQTLAKLPKLYGLTVMDTITDIASLKQLTNLKYLSLPADCLKDTLVKADLHKSLPNTRIVANEGFCLGSGWLLLLFPLVLIFRFFMVRKKISYREVKKSWAS